MPQAIAARSRLGFTRIARITFIGPYNKEFGDCAWRFGLRYSGDDENK